MIRLQPDESYASLLSTHHITQAYIQPFIGYIPNNRPPVGLDGKRPLNPIPIF